MVTRTISIALIFMAAASQAVPILVNPSGTGARAFSLAGNFTVTANDVSALYWNPAGLGFLPVRELQAGIDGIRTDARTEIHGENVGASFIQRLRFSHVGFLYSIPASRGGVSIGVIFHKPWLTDDAQAFEVTEDDETVSSDYSIYGGQNMLTAGFGLQVAPGLSLGVSGSLITGKDEMRLTFLRTENSQNITEDFDEIYYRTFIGYDLRVGALYSFLERFKVGARIVIPQRTIYEERWEGTNPQTAPSNEYGDVVRSQLASSFSGALGVSVALPFMEISAEVRDRLPYSIVSPNGRIPEDSDAKFNRMGAGAALQMPLLSRTVQLRTGYSWDQFDTHLFSNIDNLPDDWSSDGLSSPSGRHLISGGLGWLVQRFCFELAYGYQFWELSGARTHDEQSQQRLAFTTVFRF